MAIARRFEQRSAPAFAVASLGFPLGEILWPPFVVMALTVLTVSQIWNAGAALVVLLLIPLLWWSGAPLRDLPEPMVENRDRSGSDRVWRESRIWMLMPNISAMGFIMTGLLFYQAGVRDDRGWSPWWWAAAVSTFGITRIAASLGAGGLLARRSGIGALGPSLVPATAGAWILVWPELPAWGLLPAFALAGVSMGANGIAARTALIELFGTRTIGRAKSAASAIGVFATAAAPAIYGTIVTMFAWRWDSVVLAGNALFLTATVVFTRWVSPKLAREKLRRGF